MKEELAEPTQFQAPPDLVVTSESFEADTAYHADLNSDIPDAGP